MARLALDHIHHAWQPGRPVLSDITLTVADGQTLALLGPSGCGKTTLLRLVAGLETLQSGTITIGDQVVARGDGPQLPVERRDVGLVFQDFALFPHLSVAENVRFGLRRGRLRGEAARARVVQLLGDVGLAALATAQPATLSGGQAQRVALARALAPQPRVLLLDEPFSNLDATLRDEVREITRQVLRATGTTAVLVTHDTGEAMRMADVIAVMGPSGRIHQVAAPAALYRDPADPFVAGLFGPVNWLPGRATGQGLVETPLGVVPLTGAGVTGAGVTGAGLAGAGLAGAGLGGPGTGTRVTVMVRPEAVQLSAVDPRAPAADGVTGAVLDQVWLGQTTHLHIAVPGLSGHLEVDRWGEGLAVGAAVTVRLDPAQLRVFPAEPAVDALAGDLRASA